MKTLLYLFMDYKSTHVHSIRFEMFPNELSTVAHDALLVITVIAFHLCYYVFIVSMISHYGLVMNTIMYLQHARFSSKGLHFASAVVVDWEFKMEIKMA